MRITWRSDKQRRNIGKHGLDLSLAARVFADLLAQTIWDRFVDVSERWCRFGGVTMGGRFKIAVVVHTYPDLGDDIWVQVIGLREATAHARRQQDISNF